MEFDFESTSIILPEFKSLEDINTCSGWDYKIKTNLQRQVNIYNGTYIPSGNRISMKFSFPVDSIDKIKNFFEKDETSPLYKIKICCIKKFGEQLHNILKRSVISKKKLGKRKRATIDEPPCPNNKIASNSCSSGATNDCFSGVLKSLFLLSQEPPHSSLPLLSIEQEIFDKTGILLSFSK